MKMEERHNEQVTGLDVQVVVTLIVYCYGRRPWRGDDGWAASHKGSARPADNVQIYHPTPPKSGNVYDAV